MLRIWEYPRTFGKSVSQNDVVQGFSENVAVTGEIFWDYIGTFLANSKCRGDMKLFKFQLSLYIKWLERNLYIIDGSRSTTKFENPSNRILKH
jgi:hypothetical protein